MKKILFIWASLLVSLSGQTQNIERVDSLNDINAIKRDTSFIYAESTMRDAVEAQSGAHAILELKLYDWLRSKHPGEDVELLVSNSKKNWFDLLSRRGKYSRVFVYVSKRDVLPVVEPDIVEVDTVEVEESVPVLEDVLVPDLTPEEEEMVTIDSFSRIEPYVNGLKEKGRLRAYGKYASLPEDDPCYIFVYDRDGGVVAVLRQAENGQHFNMRSQKEDNVRNYKDCGAIWFQLK